MYAAGPAVKVTATLQNARTDDYDETAFTPAELPAVYTNGFLYRLISYSGDKPYQDEPVTEYYADMNATTGWWIPGFFRSTEHWAALVDEHDWGLGVINLAETGFLGGFAGRNDCDAQNGQVRDGPAGYMTPVNSFQFPRDVTFTYEFHLILGTVEESRAYAIQLAEEDRMTENEYTAQVHNFTDDELRSRMRQIPST